MYNICFYFFMFICFSVLGWVMECVTCSILEKRFVHNRGFLIGPYCPIYGYGALGVYFILTRYYNEPITLFIMAAVGASIIEYVTSYVMEKIFKARWWDYSNCRFNLEGRVCLRNSILFGICGLVFVYVVNPFLISIISSIPKLILIIISSILFVLFLIDNIISYSIMLKLRQNLSCIRKDSTYEIEEQVKEILSKNKFYLRKLFKSFPSVKIMLPTGEKVYKIITKSLDSVDKIRKERKEKINKIRSEIKKSKK